MSTQALTQKINYTVYPNPAHRQFSIQSEETLSKMVLIDSKGQVVREWTSSQDAYALEGYAQGVYFLRINWSNGQWSNEKLIIQ